MILVSYKLRWLIFHSFVKNSQPTQHTCSCFYPYVSHMMNFTKLPHFSACNIEKSEGALGETILLSLVYWEQWAYSTDWPVKFNIVYVHVHVYVVHLPSAPMASPAFLPWAKFHRERLVEG